ncbi:hypothetical protein NC77_04975 [Janthinobacterium lividum]|nr:hypothetical protein NC77_04975 [Janthinobacterium lividum]
MTWLRFDCFLEQINLSHASEQAVTVMNTQTLEPMQGTRQTDATLATHLTARALPASSQLPPQSQTAPRGRYGKQIY